LGSREVGRRRIECSPVDGESVGGRVCVLQCVCPAGAVYFQIVKCFRDEDLRADRQPEFTQIDCEMAFVEQEDILNVFEGLTRHLLKEIKGIEVEKFPRMTYDHAMKTYGNDKPDIRFGMEFGELNEVAKSKDFPVFNAAELVVGIAAPGCANYTRKYIEG